MCLPRFGRLPRQLAPKLPELMCPPEASNLIEGKLGGLADALARIGWPPLTPRRIGAAPGISSQERER
jgi:hypothetical protein